jgi:hypothetical protein
MMATNDHSCQPPEAFTRYGKPLRAAFFKAITGLDIDENDENVQIQHLPVPIDVVIAELAHAMAVMIAMHPGLATPEARRSRINMLAMGVLLGADDLAAQGIPKAIKVSKQ